jgi:hypothetical protein
MSVEELLTQARMLPRQEQLRLSNALQHDFPSDETDFANMFKNAHEIPMWSPVLAFEAAAVLMKLLEEHKKKPC